MPKITLQTDLVPVNKLPELTDIDISSLQVVEKGGITYKMKSRDGGNKTTTQLAVTDLSGVAKGTFYVDTSVNCRVFVTNENKLKYEDLTLPDISTLKTFNPGSNLGVGQTVKVTGQAELFELRTGAPSESVGSYQGVEFTTAVSASYHWHRVYNDDIWMHWFGTVGDKITDDTLAIQAAFDYIASIPGGTLKIKKPTSSYLFSSALTCSPPSTSYSGVHIIADHGSTRQDTHSGGTDTYAGYFFTCSSALASDAFTFSNWHGGSLQGLTFNLSNQTGGDGIVVVSAQSIDVKDCAVYKPYSDGFYASGGNEINFLFCRSWGRWAISPSTRLTITSVDHTAGDGGEFTLASHGLENNAQVHFYTEGTLPTGLSQTTTYYIVNSTTNTFEVSLTSGGSAIDITGNGSGTLYCKNWDQRVGGIITSSDTSQIGFKLWSSDSRIIGGRASYFTDGISCINGNNDISLIRIDFNTGKGVNLLTNSSFYKIHDVIIDQNGGTGVDYDGYGHKILNNDIYNNGRDTRLTLANRAGISFGGTFQGEYSSGTTYSSFDIVKSGYEFYLSLEDSNNGNTPSSSPLYWVEIGHYNNLISSNFIGNKPNGEVNIGWQCQEYGIYVLNSAFGFIEDTNTLQYNASRFITWDTTGSITPFTNAVKVGGRTLTLEYYKNNLTAGLSGSEMVPPSAIGARRAIAHRAFVDSILITTNIAATPNTPQNFTSAISTVDGTVSITSHGYSNNDMVRFTTTGTLPTGLTVGTDYFVINSTANDFQVAALPSGTAIVPSDTGSGTHSANRIQTIRIRCKIDGTASGSYYVDAESAQRTAVTFEPLRTLVPAGVDFNLTVDTPAGFTPTTIDINVAAILVEY